MSTHLAKECRKDQPENENISYPQAWLVKGWEGGDSGRGYRYDKKNDTVFSIPFYIALTQNYGNILHVQIFKENNENQSGCACRCEPEIEYKTSSLTLLQMNNRTNSEGLGEEKN